MIAVRVSVRRSALLLCALGGALACSCTPASAESLPDGRGYEMVSPVGNANVSEPFVQPSEVNSDTPESSDTPEGIIGKYEREGYDEHATVRLFQAAADGDGVAYIGEPLAGVGGSGEIGAEYGNQLIATRNSGGGWSTADIQPPRRFLAEGNAFEAFSSDLSVGILESDNSVPLAADAPAGGYRLLYARSSSDGSYRSLITSTPPNRNFYSAGYFNIAEEPELVFAGGSSDFGHMLFLANDALPVGPGPAAVDGGEEENNLYDSVGGQLRLVNVLPDGSTEPNAIFGSPEGDLSNVISSDGSRVFWTNLNNGNLYVREDDASGDPQTVQVDAAVGGGGRFWGASADGSMVFFTKAGDLYEYDLETTRTTDLTPGGEVQGVVGVSEDGSYVYFVADQALAAGATPQTCSVHGAAYLHENGASWCNLYVLHEGEPVRFVAKLSAADEQIAPYFSYARGDWEPNMGHRTARVTPDGRHVVFMSEANLTGYESEEREEVYVYDADTHQLTCASCGPNGSRPTSKFRYFSAFLQSSNSSTYLPRWISEDGTKVFFDSDEALVPQDTNGRLDVYEWEQDGAGSCQQTGGCVYLLSGGTSDDHSYFIDASASGNDVFFTSRAQLVPQDTGEGFVLYDARVGAPQQPAAAAGVGGCSGAGCQGAASVPVPPVFSAPSTMVLSGVGNLPAPAASAVKPKRKTMTCVRGFVKKRGRCVKQAKTRKRAKKSAKGRK